MLLRETESYGHQELEYIMVLRTFLFVIKWCKLEVSGEEAISQGHQHTTNGLSAGTSERFISCDF